jgi:hypothetical protein
MEAKVVIFVEAHHGLQVPDRVSRKTFYFRVMDQNVNKLAALLQMSAHPRHIRIGQAGSWLPRQRKALRLSHDLLSLAASEHQIA